MLHVIHLTHKLDQKLDPRAIQTRHWRERFENPQERPVWADTWFSSDNDHFFRLNRGSIRRDVPVHLWYKSHAVIKSINLNFTNTRMRSFYRINSISFDISLLSAFLTTCGEQGNKFELNFREEIDHARPWNY